MIYNSWDIEKNILKLVILFHFLPFYPLKAPKIKILKNEKICCVPKVTIIWYIVPQIWSATDIIFCHYGPFFALFPPYGPRKSKFWKNEKNTWRYYHFTNVYYKWQSYDKWFFRYGVQQTRFFVILDHFLHFYPLTTQKIKIFNNWRKPLEISSFYTSAPKIMIICYTVP